ncbi:MAG TPA: DivIVA domain-containing protein [Pseudonocardiaceae bacterium]|jgi:DivIVA domain-containing protein
MPLTPADVHNVAFSKPPIGKRGYNEDEVDAFLDLVEAELARLIEENNDLRNQVEELDQQLSSAPPDMGRSARPPEPPRPTMMTAVPTPSMVEQTSPGGDHHVQAAKVLGLAQEMADRLTGEAKAEADGMLGEARTKSEQLLSEARVKADSMVNEARTRAETMLNDARTRAETLERQSREKAASLERDAQRKHTEILGAINQEKSALEKKIDELRTFEREYRTRLKTYLESQLRDLDGRGSAAPAETGRGQQFTGGFSARAEAGS